MDPIDWTLLKKSVKEELSPEEKEALKSWLEESESQQEFYDRLTSFLSQEEGGPVDVERNFRIFMKRTQRLALSLFLRYAAVVVCLLGGAYFFYFNHIVTERPVSEKRIVAGTSRAVLYTGHKGTISLEQTTEKEILKSSGFRLDQKQNQVNYFLLDTATVLSERHTLEVPHGGEFQLCLSDGTHVFMNSQSRLSYPVVFNGDERRVELSGEAYFEVAKSAAPFIIGLRGMEIRVLGTKFNVRAYDEEDCFFTTLVNGKVEISSERQKLELYPGEQAVYNRENDLSKKQVDVTKYVAWKEGIVAFEEERLEDIMLKLGRWYNIEVFYADPKLKDICFTGSLNRYGDIRILLEKMEKLDIVRFQVKANCITVMYK